jgi:hypothetical protein
MFNGVKAYAVYINPVEGYRNNQEGYAGYPNTAPLGNGIPTGNQAQGSYALLDGARTTPSNPVGCCCCFNFGTASRNNAAGPRGGMNALYFGTGYWDSGQPSGPWFMIDVEAGVYAGGDPNNNLPSTKFDYAFGLTKNNSGNATIRVASSTCLYGAATPNLVTPLNANPPPFTWQVPGGITLGIGGDNSNSSNGTFYEGCIVNGRPSDATDLAVMNNVRLAGYGSNTPVTAVHGSGSSGAAATPLFRVNYNPSSSRAIISYTLQDARKVSMNIFDGRGRVVAAIVNGINPAGTHNAAWDTKRVPAGAYLCRVAIEGMGDKTERITVQ